MLTIQLRINGRIIATATAVNTNDLPRLSDYDCGSYTAPYPDLGRAEHEETFRIAGHDRGQSPWALVAKMAEEIARLENEAHARHVEIEARGEG